MSVTLRPDEEVDWTWAQAPDGGRYVSGYTVHKRDEAKTRT